MSGTDYTLTPNYHLYKPIPDADPDQWGDHWNENADTLDALIKSVSDSQGNFLPIAGGTLRGPLILAADPTVPLGAATRQYVDAGVSGAQTIANAAVKRGGDTMTGLLVLSGNPTAPLGAATKQYIDQGFLPIAGGTLTGPGNLVVNGTLQVGTAAPWKLALTAKGNLMLGVAEPASMAAASATNGGHLGAWVVMASNLAANAYYDGTNWRRQNTSAPQAISISGGFNFIGAAAGAQDSVASMTNLMILDGSGNLNTAGWITSGSGITSTGSASIGGIGIQYRNYSGSHYIALAWDGANFLNAYVDNTYVGGLASVGWVNGNFKLASAYTPNQIVDNGAGPRFGSIMNAGGVMYVADNYAYYLARDPNDGAWRFVENGTVNCTIDVNGGVTSRNWLVGANIQSNAGVGAVGGQMVFNNGASGRYFQFAPQWYFDWNASNGTLVWMGGQPIWTMRTGDFLCFANLQSSGGMGPYWNGSDARFKEDITDDANGLDEILKLRPVRFKRLRRAKGDLRPPEVETGFIAQEVRVVIPEAVGIMGVELADGSGGLDSESPTLATKLDPMFAAMVNSIKTIAARLAALEAKGTA